jgi:hypothetical protein
LPRFGAGPRTDPGRRERAGAESADQGRMVARFSAVVARSAKGLRIEEAAR